MSFWDLLADTRTPIILDWIGWLLMAGSVWGWIYERFRERLNRRLTEAERSYLPVRDRYRYFYADGFDERQTRRRKLRQHSTSVLVDTKREELELDTEREMAVAVWMKLAPDFVKTILPVLFYWTIVRLTEAVFVGAISKIMFGTGFLLWNCSKVLSLYYLK